MRQRRNLPIALTIAGSDSGGGAGIQADLKTFAALGVHGTSVITCLTAQNPCEVVGVEAAKSSMVEAQLETIFEELPPAAVKTGMLFSRQIIRIVAGFFNAPKRPPLIVDPVMVATSGAPLLQTDAMQTLKGELLPLAALVTPNLPEAEMLTGKQVSEPEDLRQVARLIHEEFGCAVLVKGGHLPDSNEALDIYYDGKAELLLRAPMIRGRSAHGTGCTYSAAITAYMASGIKLPRAVVLAKEFITQAISQSVQAGEHWVLNPFWKR